MSSFDVTYLIRPGIERVESTTVNISMIELKNQHKEITIDINNKFQLTRRYRQLTAKSEISKNKKEIFFNILQEH